MKVRFSLRASRHLLEIHSFIAEDNPEAAGRELERILACIDLLKSNPHLGRIVNGAPGRRLICGPNLVRYRIVDEVLSVEAVLHGKRRFRKLD